MFHLFIKYTNIPDSHDRSLSILTFIRDNIERLNGMGYYVMIHKLTENMLKDDKIRAELKNRGVEELPTLLDGETSSVVIGVEDIKRFLIKQQRQAPPPQQPLPKQQEKEQYEEPPVPQHDMFSDDGKDGDMFDESIGMMDMYKKQLTRRPPIVPPQGGRKSKLPSTPQRTEHMEPDNVYEQQGTDTKSAITKAYGDGDEDNDLLAKLMDNLGVDSY